jgi:hypothetical protein
MAAVQIAQAVEITDYNRIHIRPWLNSIIKFEDRNIWSSTDIFIVRTICECVLPLSDSKIRYSNLIKRVEDVSWIKREHLIERMPKFFRRPPANLDSWIDGIILRY